MNWILRILWYWTLSFFWLTIQLSSVPLVHARAMPSHTEKHNRIDNKRVRHAFDQNHKEQNRKSYRRLKNARINALKQDFLAKLGYDSIPDSSRFNTTVEEKRRMMRLYKDRISNSVHKSHVLFEQEEYAAKQFHQFTSMGCDSLNNCAPTTYEDGYHLHFPVRLLDPEDHRKETNVHSAVLKLYKHKTRPKNLPPSLDVDNHVRISIYQVVSSTGNNSLLRQYLDSKMVSLDSTGWETFDVSTAVKQWKHNPASNLGLLLFCDTQPVEELIDFFTYDQNAPQSLAYTNDIANEESDNSIPVLEVYTQEELVLRDRQKRDTDTPCQRGDGESRCCRYPLQIRFKDIGWDSWIVAPDGFKAYFCDGSCPHAYKMGHSFAGVQSIMNLLNPAAAPAPCCSASELSPITILHYNEQGVLDVSEYADMIVEACQCS